MSAPQCEAPGPARFDLPGRFRAYYRRLMECPGRIEQVAGGFAIGVFFGFSPWHGFHILLTLGFCALLRRSLPAGVMGALVFNVFTALFVIAAELEAGRLVLGSPRVSLPEGFTFNYQGLRLLYDMGWTILSPYIAGSVIVGGAAGIISYFWLRASLRAYRARVYLPRRHVAP